jgi:septal ring factor EnvC (AmiA/AmiB activator)
VSIAEVKQGYGEVMQTMSALRQHLDEQSNRSAQLMHMMDGLPELLRSIPEQTRVQTQLLRAIASQLDLQNTTNGHLTEAIQSLSKAADKQDHTLGQVREHLSAENTARKELHAGIIALNSTLESVEASNFAARDALRTVTDQQQQRDEQVRAMFRRSQRLTLAMTIISWALAIGALAVAGYVASGVVNQNTSNTGNAPAAPAQP